MEVRQGVAGALQGGNHGSSSGNGSMGVQQWLSGNRQRPASASKKFLDRYSLGSAGLFAPI